MTDMKSDTALPKYTKHTLCAIACHLTAFRQSA